MNKKRKNQGNRLKVADKIEYKEKKKKVSRAPYLIKLFFAVFILTVLFSAISSASLENAGLAVAIIITVIIALVGVAFDIVGVAVTSADKAPFNSMAAKKIKGAKRGVTLLKNADKVASICNDVIGDMSGIISGSAGSVISAKIAEHFENPVLKFIFPLSVTAIIATLVILGKALGKGVAIKHSNEIVFFVSKIITFFKKEK